MMRRNLSRRLFLGGAGVCLGLPMLESLMPRSARGAATAVPTRFLAWYVPNGLDMATFRPVGTGADFQLGAMMKSFAPYKEDLLMISGLQNTHQEPGNGDHAGGTGAFLTACTVPKSKQVMPGPSIDQVIADAVGQDTKLPSIQLGGTAGGTAGGCDSGYPCAFANQISFRKDGSPLPNLVKPSEVFNQLFKGLDPMANNEEVARRAALQTSALDVVHKEADALLPKLSTHDRAKLDQYLTSVREVERRIGKINGGGGTCMAPAAPVDTGTPDEFIETMADLMAIGFQCNATRVATFQWDLAGGNKDYAFIGVPGGHHGISHTSAGPKTSNQQLAKIGEWELSKLAYLIGKLKGLQDVDGTSVLHNSVLFLSSEICDGNAHNHNDMPVIVAGQGGGMIKTGRHLDLAGPAPWFADLYLAIANGFGANITKFGENSTTPLNLV